MKHVITLEDTVLSPEALEYLPAELQGLRANFTITIEATPTGPATVLAREEQKRVLRERIDYASDRARPFLDTMTAAQRELADLHADERRELRLCLECGHDDDHSGFMNKEVEPERLEPGCGHHVEREEPGMFCRCTNFRTLAMAR